MGNRRYKPPLSPVNLCPKSPRKISRLTLGHAKSVSPGVRPPFRKTRGLRVKSQNPYFQPLGHFRLSWEHQNPGVQLSPTILRNFQRTRHSSGRVPFLCNPGYPKAKAPFFPDGRTPFPFNSWELPCREINQSTSSHNRNLLQSLGLLQRLRALRGNYSASAWDSLQGSTCLENSEANSNLLIYLTASPTPPTKPTATE